MPFPKLSAVLNNCLLHALTPEIKEEMLRFARQPGYDNGHCDHYEQLKNAFATYYGMDPLVLDWQKLAHILESYNPFDTQILMGPVLRLFMKDELAAHPSADVYAIEYNLDKEQYIRLLTDIKPDGRYHSLSPEEASAYLARQLGFTIECHKPGQPMLSLPVEHPVATIAVYHHGGIDGAQAGGHWERTLDNAESIDYQIADDTQLADITMLLGDNQAINLAGLNLLKEHIRLTLDEQAHVEEARFMEAFARVALSAAQIAKFIQNVNTLPKALATQVLGNTLTEDARSFIENYNPSIQVSEMDFIARYIKAPPDVRAHMKPEPYELILIDTLLRPVGVPSQAAKRLAAYEAKHQIEANKTLSANKPFFERPEKGIQQQMAPSQEVQNDENAEQQFLQELRLLLKKAKELRVRREFAACEAAYRLHHQLSDAGDVYFASAKTKDNYIHFKETCLSVINLERPLLETHRGWKQFLGNLGLFIAGLGIGYLIVGLTHKVFTGRFLFFTTDTANITTTIEAAINNLTPPVA